MVRQIYMLDTNTASYIIKGIPSAVREHLLAVPMESVCISTITEAELLCGVEKKSENKRLRQIVVEFILRVDVLPWNSSVAKSYAKLRVTCEKEGKPLGAMDMLIAAHSVAIQATLVTNDKAFYNVKHLLELQDWTIKH